MKSTRTSIVFSALILCAFVASAMAQQDPYENYVKTSRDFKAVAQDPAMALKAWPSWTFMPWYYQWTIGFDDASGEWCRQMGINGAFTDHGHTDYLAWINKFQLRFYNDHTADKGDLHLWDGGKEKPHAKELFGTGIRVKPLNAAMLTRLEANMTRNIGNLKDSPCRAAYALDDEISWGHFSKASMWQATDEAAAYPAWLKEVYGPNAPQRDKWYSYNDILPMLKTWSVAEFDASPLMDQLSFNDSIFNNMLGDLVEHSNKVDPATPCGFVGGQSPNAFGGYDYAKIMRKIQFIEAYNLGGSQSIVRSFNPHNALPAVTTFFTGKDSAADGIWQTWYYLAEGNKGFIAWVEKWFDPPADEKNGLKATPKPWIAQTSTHWKEAGQKIGPLLSGADWQDDGVMLYYSQASIQLGWVLDAQAHGATWMNRDGDARLGSQSLGRKAWMNMLRDDGIQFTWLSYVDLIQKGIPARCKVLILPATLCLSDAEATRIKDFCRNGGTVIADYMPGLWDQHGKGRPAGGALDDMFGLKHDPKMTAKDVFGGKLWCETDQDANYGYKRVVELLTNKNDSLKDVGGFDKAVRAMGTDHVNAFGNGKAVMMNLSPQWYLAFREAGAKEAAAREVFTKHVKAVVQPWVRLKNAPDKTFGYEITYWTKGGKTIVFLISNPEISGNELGGGNAVGLKTDKVPVTLKFAKPIKNVVNERTGENLPDGTEFPCTWIMNEAVVLSFQQ